MQRRAIKMVLISVEDMVLVVPLEAEVEEELTRALGTKGRRGRKRLQ